MHTQYPDDAHKRFYTYRNRGYLQSQPGMRRAACRRSGLRFGWFFLVSRRDPAGLAGVDPIAALGSYGEVREADMGGEATGR